MRAGHPGFAVREGIERRELDALSREHPELHAVTRWDLDHCPEAITLCSLRKEGRVVSYLLQWRGNPEHPVVHWMGSAAGWKLLVARFPAPPYTAVVPPALFRRVQWPVDSMNHLEDLWFRPRTRPPPAEPVVLPPACHLLRLTPGDRELLARFVRTHPSLPSHSRVDTFDLRHTVAYAVVEAQNGRNKILAVARTGPRLPDIWMIGGVFTDPRHRGRGLGKAVTLGLALEAKRRGAHAGLYVRPENLPATRAYRAIGFRRTLSRVFVEVSPDSRRVPAPPARLRGARGNEPRALREVAAAAVGAEEELPPHSVAEPRRLRRSRASPV